MRRKNTYNPAKTALLYVQHASREGHGAGAVVVGDAGGLAHIVYHQTAGFHGGKCPVGEPAGGVGVGALFADPAAAGRKRRNRSCTP